MSLSHHTDWVNDIIVCKNENRCNFFLNVKLKRKSPHFKYSPHQATQQLKFGTQQKVHC